MVTMATRKTAMKTPGFTLVLGTQYWITSEAAVRLFGVTIMYYPLSVPQRSGSVGLDEP